MWLRAACDQSLAGVMAHWHDDSDLGLRPLIKLAWVLYHSLRWDAPPGREAGAHQSEECLAGLHNCITLTIKHVCGSKRKWMEVGCVSSGRSHQHQCNYINATLATFGDGFTSRICITVKVLFPDIDLILVSKHQACLVNCDLLSSISRTIFNVQNSLVHKTKLWVSASVLGSQPGPSSCSVCLDLVCSEPCFCPLV